MFQQLLLQVILIGLNAFFAATEIAVLSLNRMQLEKKAETGHKKAYQLLQLMDEPSQFLSTIQIGITLAGFLGSAFAADNFSEYIVHWIYDDIGFQRLSLVTLDTIAVILITLILSYFTLVLGELVPKRIAMQKPYAVASMTCGVVMIVARIVKPAVTFLSFSTNVVLKILHCKSTQDEEHISEEEILMMIEQGKRHGVVDEDESEWIHNVFEFDDTCIQDIMTRAVDVIGIEMHQSKEEILKTIQESGLSRYPVYDKDYHHILGILHAKDFLLNLYIQPSKDLVSLLSTPYFVPESMIASGLFEDMQKKQIHFAVILDEFGEMSGIITLEDLLEEIVGNIYDEYDIKEEEDIEMMSHHQWKVTGNCSMDVFTKVTGIELQKNSRFQTIGGYIFSYLHTIPQDGTKFMIEIDQLIFHILRIENKRIMEVIVEKRES